MTRILVFLVSFAAVAFISASGTIIDVPDDYPTIQEGIDATSWGDTVLVQPDTYIENISFKSYNIVVGSMFLMTEDTSYISSTIINGNSSGRVVSFGRDDSLSIIIGFTLQNGTGGIAGGIYCDGESSPTISHNIISGNSGDHGGGILCGNDSSPSIGDNIISENHAHSGGGIFCMGGARPSISNNTILGNSARDWGGGIYCEWATPAIGNNIIGGNSASLYGGGGIFCRSSSPLIEGNTINQNSARAGGGVYCWNNSDPGISNNTISGNSALEGGGIACYDNSNPRISNNIISSNSFDLGGGIYCGDNSSPIIIENIIRDNSGDRGSGIVCLWNSNPAIKNNIISGNSATGEGGGIYCVDSDPVIINNTVTENWADNRGGGIYCVNSSPLVLNTILWADATPWFDFEIYVIGGAPVFTFCDIQGGWEGEGNIDIDPLFRDPDGGDFHLMFTECDDSYDSPCIDAGHPDSLDGELSCLWGLGTIRSDLGAYGGGASRIVGIESPETVTPNRFFLFQNYPNPFNAFTSIGYTLPSASDVTIDIYDILGRRVETLVQGEQSAGYHHITWDAEDRPSGMYFYRIQAGEYAETRKMVLLK
jgi:parallel beta-helix repeat protein